MPFPIILISLDFLQKVLLFLATNHNLLEGSKQGCPVLEMLLLQKMGYPLWKGWTAGSKGKSMVRY